MFVPTNAISVRSHSLSAVHWSHTALKFTEWLITMNTSKEDQRYVLTLSNESAEFVEFSCFWPRFYIVVLGIVFFSRFICFFQFLFGLLFPFFYMDFYFFFIWTFISLFCLDFYFLFLFGPFLLNMSFNSFLFLPIAVTFWVSSKLYYWINCAFLDYQKVTLSKVFVWVHLQYFQSNYRCMFVKIVVTTPRNLKFTTFTWKKNIPTVRLYWNSMTKDILSSTIPALPACCSMSIHSRFTKNEFSKIFDWIIEIRLKCWNIFLINIISFLYKNIF